MCDIGFTGEHKPPWDKDVGKTDKDNDDDDDQTKPIEPPPGLEPGKTKTTENVFYGFLCVFQFFGYYNFKLNHCLLLQIGTMILIYINMIILLY